MPHDNQLFILISTDTVFHFLHTDGDGKEHHSPHYETQAMDLVYSYQQALHENRWMTRDEVNAERARIRKSVKATRW